MVIAILAPIVLLGVLIFIHELGHFATAKWAGIRVPRFSLGLGPKAFGFTRGETEYVVSWLPLGGYVKMQGMEEMDSIEGGAEESGEEDIDDPNRSFVNKSLPWRALVISAGVIMNWLFAAFLYGVMAFGWGIQVMPEAVITEVNEETLPEGNESLLALPANAEIVRVGTKEIDGYMELTTVLLTYKDRNTTLEVATGETFDITIPNTESGREQLLRSLEPALEPVVGDAQAGGTAEAAGLEQGDVILSIAGRDIPSWQALPSTIQDLANQEVEITYLRAGEEHTVTATMGSRTAVVGADTSEVGFLGVSPQIETERVGPIGAAVYGFNEAVYWTKFTAVFIAEIFTGDVTPKAVGGPILITTMSGEVARAGLDSFLNLMALLSINLAIINLLPIPILDGGHLMFLGIEAVRGRRLSAKTKERAVQFGFLIIIAIMVFALGNDILRLFTNY